MLISITQEKYNNEVKISTFSVFALSFRSSLTFYILSLILLVRNGIAHNLLNNVKTFCTTVSNYVTWVDKPTCYIAIFPVIISNTLCSNFFLSLSISLDLVSTLGPLIFSTVAPISPRLESSHSMHYLAQFPSVCLPHHQTFFLIFSST